jgi:hypothetical protein
MTAVLLGVGASRLFQAWTVGDAMIKRIERRDFMVLLSGYDLIRWMRVEGTFNRQIECMF